MQTFGKCAYGPLFWVELGVWVGFSIFVIYSKWLPILGPRARWFKFTGKWSNKFFPYGAGQMQSMCWNYRKIELW